MWQRACSSPASVCKEAFIKCVMVHADCGISWEWGKGEKSCSHTQEVFNLRFHCWRFHWCSVSSHTFVSFTLTDRVEKWPKSFSGSHFVLYMLVISNEAERSPSDLFQKRSGILKTLLRPLKMFASCWVTVHIVLYRMVDPMRNRNITLCLVCLSVWKT